MGKHKQTFWLTQQFVPVIFSSPSCFQPILLLPPKSRPYKATAWKSLGFTVWLKDEFHTPCFNIRDFTLLECSLALSAYQEYYPKP